MSLQVWLPLTGDLHNQGLSNVNITNTAAMINNFGKIGKCYSFGTAKSYFKFDNVDFMHNFSECSISLWINILTWNTSYATYFQFGLGSTPWAHYIFGLLRNNAASTLCFTISNGSSATNANCLTPALELNTWYHLTFTYANGHCKIYVNGENTKDYITTIVPNFAGITTGIIGACNNGSNYQTNCLMNDFRIYDHALSDKEVEEVSKGLVLHYKLDDPNKNLLRLIPRTFNPTAYNAYQLNMTENLVADQTYTIQLWDVDVYHSAKTAAQTGVWIYWGGGSVQLLSWAGPTYFTPEGETNYHADYLVKTFTPTSTNASGSGAGNAWFNVYNSVSNANGTRNMHIGAWKLEKGSVPTPLSSPDENIIQDSSGLQNNGIISGILVSENNSPRYNLSTYFNGSSYILTPAGNMGWNDLSELTLSCWMYPTASMTGWRGSWGIATDTTYVAKGFAITDYGNEFRVTYTNGSTYVTLASGKTLTQNEWHHCAATLKDTTIKMYFDGELVKTYTLNWGTATLNTNARIELGVDLPGSDEKFTGNYSDARLYATALTEEQILDLYHTSASIDKEGNVYAREIIE